MRRDSRQSLTVFCPLGLSNRLRVLLSGLALAAASGREFQMFWPITPACAAPFSQLFSNAWPVQTVDAGTITGLPYISGWFGLLPDLLTSAEPDLIVGHPTWLIRPDQYENHDRLALACLQRFHELQPIPEIQERIDAFCRNQFRPQMIGVHLRRGDLLAERPDVASNTDKAMQAVDRFLTLAPDAGVLLCTDDGAPHPQTGHSRAEGVRERFVAHFGSRVVYTQVRTLERSKTEAIQDALIDLWLLRATDYFVGTTGSSFSEMSVYGRNIPQQMVAAGAPSYHFWERLAYRTGLYGLLKVIGKRQFGQELPFPVLLRYYARAPFRIVKRAFSR